jgi:hypothetical protein
MNLMPAASQDQSKGNMKRIGSLILGLIAVFVGLGIALPALAKLKSYGAVPSCGLLFLGLVMVTGGVGSAVYGLLKRNG